MLLTSAMKGLGTSIKEALTSWKNNEYKFDSTHSAKIQNLGINEDAVALPTTATTGDEGCWGFKTWSEADYTTLVNALKAGTITVSGDTSKFPTTSKVKVTEHTTTKA